MRVDPTIAEQQDRRILGGAVYSVSEWHGSDDAWDSLVVNSQQGSLFCETVWLNNTGLRYRQYLAHKGQEPVGGLAVFESQDACTTMGPLTPFGGIFFASDPKRSETAQLSVQKNATLALLNTLEKRYSELQLAQHRNFRDVRVFYWHTFGQPVQYDVTVRYTYLVDLTNLDALWQRLEQSTRYEIAKAKRTGITVTVADPTDYPDFNRLWSMTFARQGLQPDSPPEVASRLFHATHAIGRSKLFLARDAEGNLTSGAVIAWDHRCAYYLMGASDPATRNNGAASLTLWTAFCDLAPLVSDIDLVGCNSPDRDRFKRGFGGVLKDYFVISGPRVSSYATQ